MMDTLHRSPVPLRDILYEFSIAKDVPDAELLDEFTRRYPEYADALTEFAVELLVDTHGPVFTRHRDLPYIIWIKHPHLGDTDRCC